MAWTTPQDVLDRWIGSDAPTDTDQIAALISDAETIILAEYPAIQNRIDDALLQESTVVMVVCWMVSRIIRNPEGLTYWQQQTGPFGQARNYGNTAAGIWLTADEKALLAPKRKGKAFEIDLAPYAGLSSVARLKEKDLTDLELMGEALDGDLD